MKFAEIIPGLLERKKYYRKVVNVVYILQLGDQGLEFVAENKSFKSHIIEEEDLESEWQEYSQWREVLWHEGLKAFATRSHTTKRIMTNDCGDQETWICIKDPKEVRCMAFDERDITAKWYILVEGIK